MYLILQVLVVEQMLTTAGGWQDQVGGLSGGIKVGHSAAALPLRVDVKFLQLSDVTVRAFSDRLFIVYTGKTRLARNLLQVILIRTLPMIVCKQLRSIISASFLILDRMSFATGTLATPR